MYKVEKELDLADLFWRIMAKWKLLVIFGIIGAVLFGGLSYRSSVNAYNTQLEMINSTDKPESLTFTDEELAQIREAESLQSSIARLSDYMEHSIYYNMDFSKTLRIVLDFYVDAGYSFNYTEENVNDPTPAIVSYYTSQCGYGEISKDLADSVFSSDPAYVAEIVSAQAVGNGIFRVSILCPEDTDIDAGSEAVRTYVESCHDTAAALFGEHTLTFLSASSSVAPVKSIVDLQLAYRNLFENYSAKYAALEKTLSDDVLSYINSESLAVDEEEPTLTPPSVSMKYVIVGIILGIAAVAFVIVVKAVFSSKLQTESELASADNAPMLGVLFENEKLSATARLINKLRGRKVLDRDNWINIICAGVKSDRNVAESGRVYITGSAWEKLDNGLIEKLCAKLKECGISPQCGGNIYYDTESYEKMQSIKNVLLVEKLYASLRSDIAKEAELISKTNSHTVGYVIVK